MENHTLNLPEGITLHVSGRVSPIRGGPVVDIAAVDSNSDRHLTFTLDAGDARWLRAAIESSGREAAIEHAYPEG